MGMDDKASNKAQEVKGNAKEFIGDKTDNADLEAEGRGDKMSAKGKQAGEHVKDAARDIKKAFKK